MPRFLLQDLKAQGDRLGVETCSQSDMRLCEVDRARLCTTGPACFDFLHRTSEALIFHQRLDAADQRHAVPAGSLCGRMQMVLGTRVGPGHGNHQREQTPNAHWNSLAAMRLA